MTMLKKLAKKPAVLWVAAAVVAALAGVAWAYYWRVFYYLDARVSPVLVTGGCVLACLAAVAAAGILHYGLRSFAARAAACIAVCGLLFTFANPPMQAPDESEHFLRTYAISMGRFDFDADRTYPDDVAALYHAFPGAWVNAHTSAVWRRMPQPARWRPIHRRLCPETAGRGRPRAERGRQLCRIPEYSGYHPGQGAVSFMVLPFLPGPLACLWRGCWALARWGACTAGALPTWRSTRAVLPGAAPGAEVPPRLSLRHAAAALAVDGRQPELRRSAAGLLLPDACPADSPHLDHRRCGPLRGGLCLVNIAKPYINLLWAFLPLILLREAFCARGRRWHWTAGMLAASLAVTRFVEWYGAAFRYNYGTIGRMGGEDVNQLEQLLFILKNPLRYLAVLLGTLYENDFFVGQLGLFGWKDLPIPLLNLLGPALLLVAAVLSAGRGQTITRRRVVPLAAFAAVYAVGMMTAMYITYTPVTMVRIVGLQARYFLPVFLLAAMLLAAPLRRALSANLTHRRAERWALRIFAPCAALGAVLLFQHYFIGPIATIPG